LAILPDKNEHRRLKERLQEYALIAEIIGGIAIVCSLIFVGVQIRQNSEVSEINAYQDLISQITLMNSLRVQDPEFAELFWRFDHGEPPRNDAERARLEAFLYMVFRHGDLAYRQYDKGLLDRDGLVSVLAPTRTFLNTALGKEVWAILSPSLQPDYVVFVKQVGLLCGTYTGNSSHCETEKAP
jgi:hypothetical protein